MVKVLTEKNGVVSTVLEDGRVVVLNDKEMCLYPKKGSKSTGKLAKVGYDDAMVLGDALRVIFADKNEELEKLRKSHNVAFNIKVTGPLKYLWEEKNGVVKEL